MIFANTLSCVKLEDSKVETEEIRSELELKDSAGEFELLLVQENNKKINKINLIFIL